MCTQGYAPVCTGAPHRIQEAPCIAYKVHNYDVVELLLKTVEDVVLSEV